MRSSFIDETKFKVVFQVTINIEVVFDLKKLRSSFIEETKFMAVFHVTNNLEVVFHLKKDLVLLRRFPVRSGWMAGTVIRVFCCLK